MTLLLVGCGPMAIEYAKVLKAQNCDFITVGRGEQNAQKFTLETSCSVISGGLDRAQKDGKLERISRCIISVGVLELYETCKKVVKLGVQKILLEKPGILTREQAIALRKVAARHNTEIYIAYNRRFLSSIMAAKKIISEDGGLTSFNFDFTEWGHVIETLETNIEIKKKWVIANSSHVIDLAFFIGGNPGELNALQVGKLAWHPAGSVFVGSGLTESGIPFSYHSDWNAPGRWGLEFHTKFNTLILRPMEQLHKIEKGHLIAKKVLLPEEDEIHDINFKPGLFKQVKAFNSNSTKHLCTIDEMVKNIDFYTQIAGYS